MENPAKSKGLVGFLFNYYVRARTMTMEQVVEFVTKLGFPISIVVALLYGLWQGVKWTGTRFDKWVEPLFAKHLTVINSLIQSTDKNTETLQQHSELLKQHTTMSEKTVEFIAESVEYKKILDKTLTDLQRDIRNHREKTENGLIRDSPSQDVHKQGRD